MLNNETQFLYFSFWYFVLYMCVYGVCVCVMHSDIMQTEFPHKN